MPFHKEWVIKNIVFLRAIIIYRSIFIVIDYISIIILFHITFFSENKKLLKSKPCEACIIETSKPCLYARVARLKPALRLASSIALARRALVLGKLTRIIPVVEMDAHN